MHSYHYFPPEEPHWIVKTYHFIGDALMWTIFNPSLWIILILFSPVILTACFKEPADYEYKPAVHVKKDLVAFSNSAKIGGSFILGFGQIEHNFVYIFLYKEKDGGIKQEYAYVERSTVYEDGGDQPYIECVSDDRFGASRDCRNLRYSNVAFHIPPGSINRQFTLDINK